MKLSLCRLSRIALLLIAIRVASPAAVAQSTSSILHIHLDPATTEVHFTLKDTLHTVHGSFHMSTGEITVNSTTGEATGRIEIDINSGASGNDSRDKRMKHDLLETASFPVATFEPHKVTGLSASAPTQKISVVGVLTLHGMPHPMTLQFDVTLSGAQAAAVTSFKIPYVAWGIKDPSIPFVHVEKEVTVDLAAKGTLQTQ